MLILRNLTTKKPGKRNELIAGKGDIWIIQREKVLMCGGCGASRKNKIRMRNLLQENNEIESQRTSIHICNSHKLSHSPKIAKEYAFLPTLDQKQVSCRIEN